MRLSRKRPPAGGVRRSPLVFQVLLVLAWVANWGVLLWGLGGSTAGGSLGWGLGMGALVSLLLLLGCLGYFWGVLSLYADVIAERERRMIESAKMSALGLMAGGIGHELNNPLAILRGRAELAIEQLERGIQGPVPPKTHLQAIIDVTDRIARVVSALVVIAKDAEKGGAVQEKVSRIISSAVSLCCERFSRKGIRLEVDYPMGDHTLLCRPVQISHALLNLLSNAYEAVQGTKDPWVRVSVRIQNEVLHVRVLDSGPGVPHRDRERIFEPFFTTRQAGQGLGWGSVSLDPLWKATAVS